MYKQKVTARETCQQVSCSLCPQNQHLQAFIVVSALCLVPAFTPPPIFLISSQVYYYEPADLPSTFKSTENFKNIPGPKSPASSFKLSMFRC